MFRRIRQIYFFTKNVESSAKWYEQLLQLSQDLSEAVSGQFALIRIDDVEFCFHLADEKSPVSSGGSVTYWEVNNFNETLKRATDLGGIIYRGPIRVHARPHWMAQIKDPLGNVFGVEGPRR